MLNTDNFKDKRGDIYFLDIDGVKLNVLVTNAGILRGGEMHPGKQFNIILKGEFEVTTRQNDLDVVKKYGPNELIITEANVPHLFKSLTDSVMLEWRDSEFKAEYFPPYRELIDKQLDELK